MATRTTGARLKFAAKTLQLATGDKIYLIGPRIFPGQDNVTGLKRLPLQTIDWKSGGSPTFEFKPPGMSATHLASRKADLPRQAVGRGHRRRDAEDGCQPARQRPDQEARDRRAARPPGCRAARLVPLTPHRAARVAAIRRRDQVAEGHYAVSVPENAPGELGDLSERFPRWPAASPRSR